ncbi:DUF4197 family protein [Novosphingobium decolorationis]|uniref:DUF4197 family protein n=1 Tax=Novosphingobium decolorationis TaxID=2698673 RepID=A0ABX8E159_9SPHN|nr:DUF4197 family protein [Novosphingobium decolorationis]QVM82842.1 DUF4197 family protein [Novosphingobium decolorationis]
MRSWGMQSKSAAACGAAKGLNRRDVLAGGAALVALSVLGGGLLGSQGARAAVVAADQRADVVRHLLAAAAKEAIEILTKSEGFWNSSVARVGLPDLFKSQPSLSETQKSALMYEQNRLAEEAVREVAPRARAPIAKLEVPDTDEILNGSFTAATSYLRAQVGMGLIEAMTPILVEILKKHDDSYTVKVVKSLPEVTLAQAAAAMAVEADNAIWYEVGVQEASLRRDPEASGDPLLIAAFGDA